MLNKYIVEEKRSFPISETFLSTEKIVIKCDDALNFLKSIPSATVRLVLTSPPYNIGKTYEKQRELDIYLAFQTQIIAELVRILTDDGSICWEVGNYVNDGEIVPLDIPFYSIFKKFGLQLRNRIIWHFDHGLHCTKRYSGRYETILWFTKSSTNVYNLDSVRVPAKYPSKRAFKGPNKGQLTCNPLGKNPSDVWCFARSEWEDEIWEIPNVKSNHPEKTKHPCQFPIELCERCILAHSHEDDWVLDPFMGVGSTILAALMHNRRAIGIDKEIKYVKKAKERLDLLANGKLKHRPMGKQIYQPTGNESQAQLPNEWTSKNNSKKKGFFTSYIK